MFQNVNNSQKYNMEKSSADMTHFSDSEATVSDVDDENFKDRQSGVISNVKQEKDEDEEEEQEEEIIDSDIELETQSKSKHFKIEHSDEDDGNDDSEDEKKELYCICQTSDIDRFMM